jgi:hypothetical protein
VQPIPLKPSSLLSLFLFALIRASGIGAIPSGPHGLFECLSPASDDNNHLICVAPKPIAGSQRSMSPLGKIESLHVRTKPFHHLFHS